MTKAIGFILVRRETGVLGSYYRAIGVLQNIEDPQAGDISAGIELIETSPYFAYGDQRQIVSGVMTGIYSENRIDTNVTAVMNYYPPEYWPNTHTFDLWFIGNLLGKEEVRTWARKPEDQRTVGYYLKFKVDTVLAADPRYATQGHSVALLFLFEGHESAVPAMQAMDLGQRYFIHGWEEIPLEVDLSWENTHYANLEIKPLGDGQPWYIPIAKGASIDLSDPILAPYKNEIEVLNENLHTLGIIATADMSAMPRTQEASRLYYLTAGRWLNHQDELDGNKAIVVPESFAKLRGLNLGDEIQLTFRPLTDTFFGLIRDGVDSLNWRSYPTYQDSFRIVGLYNCTTCFPHLGFIPTSSLRPGFASSTHGHWRSQTDYSFVLDSSRQETGFMQVYRDRLAELGISLTFVENNGPAYWAAVDPIRRSSTADLLVFGLLVVVALILAVFLYLMARRRDYAILRALGVPVRRANVQTMRPLLLLGGLGIIAGGLPAWKYALDQAKASLSTLPTPAGVTPSADLSPFALAGLCAAMSLLLASFAWLGVFFLARKPVFELLQGETARPKGSQKRATTSALSQPIPASSSSLARAVDKEQSARQERPADRVNLTLRKKYRPTSLSRYVIHHILRSGLKSILTLAVALGFLLAAGWIRQTMERAGLEVHRLYDTILVEADIVLADPSARSAGETPGTGFVYLKTVHSVLNSGFVQSSVLEADTVWFEIAKLDDHDVFDGVFPVFAFDSPEAFHSGLADPGSIVFAPGWDMDRFAAPRTREELQAEGVVALFPASLLEQMHLKVGETVRISDKLGHTYICFIAGGYSGAMSRTFQTGGGPILIPLSALEAMDGSNTKFTVARFVLDPKRNRELAQLRVEMEEPMKLYGGTVRFIIWDEELRIVVAQLEKNLSLLKVLYPVVIAVSVLIGAGLCFLLLLQATREAAILRVLGTTQKAVRLALLVEPLFLSMVGVVLGLGIARLLGMTSDLVPLSVSAGLYLAGALAGSVVGAISVTNKRPIELLQVKE